MSFEKDKKKGAEVLQFEQNGEKVKQSLFNIKENSDKNNSLILENDSLIDEVTDKVSDSCKDY